MPLPVGHAVAGLIAARLVSARWRWKTALGAIVIANLADLDFLPGFLLGQPNRFHHGPSHTLMAALLLWVLFRLAGPLRRTFPLPPGVVFWTYGSHLALDWITVDLRPPFGMQLFWPFSNEWYLSAHPLFLNIERASDSARFFPSLFNVHNLAAAGLELLWVGAILLGVVGVQAWIGRQSVIRG